MTRFCHWCAQPLTALRLAHPRPAEAYCSKACAKVHWKAKREGRCGRCKPPVVDLSAVRVADELF